jgi:hypothetical protein
MKIKTKHNKKRNTSFLYEVLVRQMTKFTLEEIPQKKEKVLGLLKKYFSNGTPMAEELKLYRTILGCQRVKPPIIEKVIQEAKRRYDKLDKEEIFAEQSKLISVINRNYGKSSYDVFIPNYKYLASISAIFNRETSIKTKVLLERTLTEELSSYKKQPSEHELMGSKILLETFLKKYNDEYSGLHEEQKELLNIFITSFEDDTLTLRTFLNEELGRLKEIVTESVNMAEIKSDTEMLEKTNKVIQEFVDFQSRPVDTLMVQKVLRLQNLAREIQD